MVPTPHSRCDATVTRRRALLGAFTAAVATAMNPSLNAAEPSDEYFRKLPKAMWVWKVKPTKLSDLRAFALEWKTDRLLLSISRPLLDTLVAGDPRVIGEIQSMRESKLEVIALSGDPSWAEKGVVPQYISAILDVDTRRRLFDGLALDVEPHALPSWHAGPATRERLLLGLLRLFEAMKARAPYMPLDAALHPIYANMTFSDGRNCLGALCRSLNSVSLMAYRNRAAATISWARTAIGVMEEARVPWRIGVLVDITREPGISYVGKDRSKFVSDMKELDRELRADFHPNDYNGLIFEDYDALRKMLKE